MKHINIFVAGSKDLMDYRQRLVLWANHNNYKYRQLNKPVQLNIYSFKEVGDDQDTYIGNDGRKYEGDWADDKRNGYGVLTTTTGARYKGYWVDTGEGLCFWADGSRYKGSWKDNKRTGYGVMVYADGTRYEGMWQDDMRNGHGTLHLIDASSFEGEWTDDLQDGYGILTLPSGKQVRQIWENGKQIK